MRTELEMMQERFVKNLMKNARDSTQSKILRDQHGHEFELITSGGVDGRLRAELIETRESADRRQRMIEEFSNTTRGPENAK